MTGLIALREEIARVAAEAKPLAMKAKAGEALSDEENTRYDELVTALNDLGPKYQEAQRRQSAADALIDADREHNRPAGARASGLVPNGDNGVRSRAQRSSTLRSPGRKFVDSEQYKRAIKTPRGIMQDDPVQVGSLFGQRYTAEYDGGVLEQRTLVTSGTPSGSMLLPQVLPTIYRPEEKPLVARDVLLNMRTNSDQITVLQEASFTNNAAEVAEATTVSNGAKPESALSFQEVTFPVQIIAHWIPITRRTLEDTPFMETYINQRLLTGLARREDNEFINGDGVSPNLTGLLNTSGIQVLDAAYFAGAPVTNAGQTNENLNRLLRAKIKLLTTGGGAQASFVLLNPADVEKILTVSDANRNYLFGGPAGNMNVIPIWGMTTVWTENIAAGTALVGDGTMAAVADRSDAQLYTTDSHSDFFIRNILVILAEERVALPVFRPLAFAKVALV
jgi:HK97 family phage major capsid protein